MGIWWLLKACCAFIVAPFFIVFKLLMMAYPGVWSWLCTFEWMKVVLAFFGIRKPSSVHGDADWATLKQLKKAGNLDMRGFYATRVNGKPVATHHERSLIMMAPPGAGKSQTIIAGVHALKLVPLAERPTLIISDAAGELHKSCAAVLVAMGYDIGLIDLVRPEDGGKYDLLSFPRLDPKYLETDVRTMCQLILPPNKAERNPHFRDFARLMLRDTIVMNMKYEGNNKTIAQLADEIIDDDLRKKLIARMEKKGAEFAAIKIFEKLGKNEGPGMLSTSLNSLEAWRLPNVKELSNFGSDMQGRFQRGWQWQSVFTHSKPVAIFIRTGLGIGGGEYARVMMGNAINTARRIWDATGKPLARPLRLIVDEAAALGHLVALPDAHNELRKARVTVMACFLSKADLDRTYGDDAATLWNGCDHLVFGGGKDMETYEAYSKMIGDMTVESQSTNSGDHGKSEGRNQMARRRIKPDELRRMEATKCVAILGSLATFADKPFRITKDGPKYL